MHTDEGFREIQLNGKQLVFLFMAATVVSVVIFLCGVLVGPITTVYYDSGFPIRRPRRLPRRPPRRYSLLPSRRRPPMSSPITTGCKRTIHPGKR